MAREKYKIEYDREGCIGAAACVAVCAENWVLSMKDGKADFKKDIIDEDELENNLEAAKVCPVEVIKIKKISTGEYLDLK